MARLNIRLSTHCQIANEEVTKAQENVTAENGTRIEPDTMCIASVALTELALKASKRPEATMGNFVRYQLSCWA